MLTANEIKIMNEALETRAQQLQRQINTEKDEQIKEIRTLQLQHNKQMQAKINTKGLFNEPQISKQK